MASKRRPEEVEVSDERRTWRMAEADAREAAREWVRDEYDGDDDLIGDAAHEYADGDSDVIYTAHARSIWQDSTHVQRYEQEADGLFGPDSFASIDQRITAAVYLAIRHAFEMEAYDAIENADDEDEADVYLIRNKVRGNLYWSNDDGWVDFYSATRFDSDERDVNLPMGGEWVSEDAEVVA